MPNPNMTSRVENERTLVLERTFNAPPALVYKAYSNAEHLKHWWGPRGWNVTYCKVDFRPGGVWHYCMKCVDKNQGSYFGMESWGKAIYKDMVAPKKISYTDFFSDAEGNSNMEMPSTDVDVEFVDIGGKTKMITRGLYATKEALKTVMDMGMLEGISQTWDRLEEHLATMK
ncbi:MAG: SRPBCC domain-containing protein [Bdellovibrionaceae bacterium]|nr:SRPBCC domain-containing protein [Pseudobdellovibrionaceae bacterium]